MRHWKLLAMSNTPRAPTSAAAQVFLYNSASCKTQSRRMDQYHVNQPRRDSYPSIGTCDVTMGYRWNIRMFHVQSIQSIRNCSKIVICPDTMEVHPLYLMTLQRDQITSLSPVWKPTSRTWSFKQAFVDNEEICMYDILQKSHAYIPLRKYT